MYATGEAVMGGEPASIVHVSSDVSRPRCPPGDRGAAGVRDTPYYRALGAPRSRRQARTGRAGRR